MLRCDLWLEDLMSHDWMCDLLGGSSVLLGGGERLWVGECRAVVFVGEE